MSDGDGNGAERQADGRLMDVGGGEQSEISVSHLGAAGGSGCSCFEGVPIQPLAFSSLDDHFNHRDEIFPFESSIK